LELDYIYMQYMYTIFGNKLKSSVSKYIID